jgi:phosphotransferase family enzyme
LHLHLPPDAPVALVAALSALGAIISNLWREGRRAYLKAESPGGPLFLRYSTDRADVPVLEHEADVRRIIGDDGALRTPAVIEAGAGWLIEEQKDTQPVAGAEAIDSVLAAAADLPGQELPAFEQNPARTAALITAARRRTRLALSALPLRDVARARAIIAEPRLPLVTSHGDLHAGNVLVSDGDTWLVDWELSGDRPAGYDLMQLWPTLAHEADRERLWQGAVEIVGKQHRRALTELRYALAVRTIANKLCTPSRFQRDFEGGRRILALLPELRT